MAVVAISALPAGGTPGGTDVLPMTQSGVTKKVTMNQLMAGVLVLLGDTDPAMAADSDLKFPTQKAVGAYINSKVNGLNWKVSVRSNSAGNIAGTYNNGSSGVGATITATSNGQLGAQNGTNMSFGDRLLLWKQTIDATNGIFLITDLGSVSTPYILTRVLDNDTGPEMVDATVFVQEGADADSQFTCTTNGPIVMGSTSLVWTKFNSQTQQRVVIPIFVGDETTAITAGTNKTKIVIPYAAGFTLDAVVASLSTPQTSGSIFTVDINEANTSVLSTKLTIDNTEVSSGTAATTVVISDSSLAGFAEIEIDVDQVGDGTAKGLKVYLIGRPA